jgi:acyl-CoA synthetase (AMP-forming)/AMP-acid ligase II
VIHEALFNNAEQAPDRIAVIQGQRHVTYRDLNAGVLHFAAYLTDRKIYAGDRVCIMAENSPEYMLSYLGVQRAGAVSVAVNPQYSSRELSIILKDCMPRVLVVEKKCLKPALEALTDGTAPEKIVVIADQDPAGLLSHMKNKVNIPSSVNIVSLNEALNLGSYNSNSTLSDKNSIASIIYTSGTTGKPKGVMLTHENFMANACSIIDYLDLTSADRVMVVLPFYYSYGTSLLTTHILVGGSLVLENSFMYPNVILKQIIDEEVTGFAGVPSTFAILLNRSNIRNYKFSSLRYITQAGGPMSPKHAGELAEILPGTDIHIMYGQTEATARLTNLDPRETTRKPGSIGKAIPGVSIELRKQDGTIADVGEEGEIVAQGRNIMAGYWNNPEETQKVLKDGRLYTGDLAVRDEDGFLKIISRRSDMIKSGAHRISPKEIEEIILELSEVHEVAVVGVEDEILGVVIKAFIVPKDGHVIEEKKVKRYCQSKLSPFKIPKMVEFVRELPKTNSGKVRKYLLVNEACSR